MSGTQHWFGVWFFHHTAKQYHNTTKTSTLPLMLRELLTLCFRLWRTACMYSVCPCVMLALSVHVCASSVGMLVLDPVSAPRWRLDCSRCSFLIYLPKDLHDARVSKERCEVRGPAALLDTPPPPPAPHSKPTPPPHPTHPTLR